MQYSKLATTRGVKSEREKKRGEMREYSKSGRGRAQTITSGLSLSPTPPRPKCRAGRAGKRNRNWRGRGGGRKQADWRAGGRAGRQGRKEGAQSACCLVLCRGGAIWITHAKPEMDMVTLK